ncbi:MAG TPA: hypothetical protein VD788_13115 [Candidatus Polarisedimenticolaceae bacterium]|nr:hypothetical protein [Candidatus Polarisedimenticolaceae bacterium]
MRFLLTFHGEMRWLVVLAAVVVALRSAYGWARGRSFGKGDRVAMAVLTTLIDVNLLLGLVLLFRMPGGFPSYRLEHAVTMVIALLVAHSWMAWKRSEDSSLKFRNNLLVALAVLVLIVLGVLRLRGAWVY